MFTYVSVRCITQVRGTDCTDENPDARDFSDSGHIINASQYYIVHVGAALFAPIIESTGYWMMSKTESVVPTLGVASTSDRTAMVNYLISWITHFL